MSWLVGPTGLSRLTTPSIGALELALAFDQDSASPGQRSATEQPAARA